MIKKLPVTTIEKASFITSAFGVLLLGVTVATGAFQVYQSRTATVAASAPLIVAAR